MIIAIDGTAASGKGTLAKKLAARLNLAHLDTGALYRITGEMLHRQGLSPAEVTPENAAKAAENLDLSLMEDPAIRTAKAGEMASVVAVLPKVRVALMAFQQNFAQMPPAREDGAAYDGAVLDGRDIGTVILPDADVKFFVDAKPEIRAERRLNELLAHGEEAEFEAVKSALISRDDRDRNRETAPLIPADDAVMVDTSAMGVEAMVDFACDHLKK